MGFWNHIPDPESAPKPRAASRPKPESIVNPDAIGCDACALRSIWGTISTPRMEISGNWQTGDILALAEGPGEQEDIQGKALVGPSGKLLRENIPHRHKDRLAFQNVVRCRPPGNRTPSPQEMHACSGHLKDDIENMPNLKAIIGLGGVALQTYFPGASIMRVHGIGFPIKVGKRELWYYPVFHPAYVLHEQAAAERRNRSGSADALFKADLARFFREVDRWPAPQPATVSPTDVIIPTTYDEARSYIARMKDPIAVDLESSKLRPYEKDAELITAAFSDGRTTIAFACEHPSGRTTWGTRLVMETVSERPWIAHNAAHELAWFRYLSDLPICSYDDTMAYARCLFERQGVLGLDEVSQLVLGVNIKRLSNVDASRIMEFTLEEVLPYNGLDAWASARIHRRVGKTVNREDYNRILGAISATTNMELMGVPYDIQEARTMKSNLLARQADIRFEASRLYEVRQFEADRGSEFKITSAPDVGEALVQYGKCALPRTEKGKQYATDEETLSKFDNPLAKAVLEDREIAKIVSYLDPTLQAPAKFPDGLLHPTYTTMHTSTLRLSSRDPNIQNYPVRKHPEIRRQIVAPSGCMFVKFDYGQLQMRIQGWASRDRELCSSIINHVDIHSYWLDQILGVYPDYLDRLASETGETDESKIRKQGRNVIKSDFVFSSLFGSNADTTTERTGIPRHHVEDVLGLFWNTYREVRSWQREQYREYRDRGHIRFMTGRLWRGTITGTEPINYPIQGMEADIVMEAMDELSQLAAEYDDWYFHPRLQIHDDLSFFLPLHNPEPYIEEIQKVMIRVRYQFQNVPLTVECKVGNNWCDTEEVAVFEGEYA